MRIARLRYGATIHKAKPLTNADPARTLYLRTIETKFGPKVCKSEAFGPDDDPIKRASQVAKIAEALGLTSSVVEIFGVLLLDGQHRATGWHLVSQGTLTSSLVHPREVFAPAITQRAAAIIIVHNHPSGDTNPSRADIDVTARLIESGKLLGMPVLDHMIVGGNGALSMRADGIVLDW